jgi:hypothetical protein
MIRLDEITAALALLGKKADVDVTGKALRAMDGDGDAKDGNDDDNDDGDDDDDDDHDDIAVADGKGVEPVFRLKMELGAGGALDVERNLLKDENDVKAVLGAPSHLNVAALHRALTLQKMYVYMWWLMTKQRLATMVLHAHLTSHIMHHTSVSRLP